MNELIITKRHVTSIENFTEKEISDFAEIIHKRYRHLKKEFPKVQAFINCGFNAGGSMEHFHGQIVGVNAEIKTTLKSSTPCKVCQDTKLARANNMVIVRNETGTTYVPWAPSHNLEIRVASPHLVAGESSLKLILSSLHEVLLKLQNLNYKLPYNILLHLEDHNYAQLLLRVDSGIVYPMAFNIVPITTDTSELVLALKN